MSARPAPVDGLSRTTRRASVYCCAVDAVRATGLVKRFGTTTAVDGRRPLHRARRGPRAARPQRRRQDDAAADAVRPDPPRRRHGRAAGPHPGSSRRRRARCGGGLRRGALLLSVSVRTLQPEAAGQARRTACGARRDRRRAWASWPRRPGGGPRERLLDRDAPATRPRCGAAAPPAAAPARRADQRARPGRDPRGGDARPRARRRRRRGPALEPPHRRAREAVRLLHHAAPRAGRVGRHRRRARCAGARLGLRALHQRRRARARAGVPRFRRSGSSRRRGAASRSLPARRSWTSLWRRSATHAC